MHAITVDQKITFLAGRPDSGKTSSAIETCRLKLQEGWKVIYYHAEGKMDANPSDYGAETPEQILQIRLFLDPFISLADLYHAINMPVEGLQHEGTLVVIDCLDFFDCGQEDLFDFIGVIPPEDNTYFLLLSLIPRYLEKKTTDHVEQYVERTYPTKLEHKIVALGTFSNE